MFFKKKKPVIDFRKPDPSSLMGRELDGHFFFDFRNTLRDVAYGPVRDLFMIYKERFVNDFTDAVWDMHRAMHDDENIAHVGYLYAYFKPPKEFDFINDNFAYAVVGIMYWARMDKYPIAYALRRIQERIDYENRPPVVPPLHPSHVVRRRSVKLPSRRINVRSNRKIHQGALVWLTAEELARAGRGRQREATQAGADTQAG